MNKVYLITGTNKGDRLLNILRVKELISFRIGKPLRLSHIYESDAWGYHSEYKFYNQCLVVNTKLDAMSVLYEIFRIERDMGRTESEELYSDRFIDIDILFYNADIVQTDNLTIPHPLLHKRRFVLEPLNELAPAHIHPVLHKSVRDLLKECPDKLFVEKLEHT